MPQFDPYLKWLGIRNAQRPPNHYRLLGLELYETDSDVIATAADRQMAHVHKYQTGEHAERSQRLLNEIAAARLCLLQADRKQAYDAQLQRDFEFTLSDEKTSNEAVVWTPPQVTSTGMAARRQSRSRFRRYRILAWLFVLLAIGGGIYWLARETAPDVPKMADDGETNRRLPSLTLDDHTDRSSLANGKPSNPANQAPPDADSNTLDAPPGGNESTADLLTGPGPSNATLDVPAPWNVDAPAGTPPPAPAPSDPWGPVLLAAREGNVSAARERWRKTLDGLQSPPDRQRAQQIGLSLDRLAAFWNCVAQGLATVRAGDSIELRGVSVRVEAISDVSITLGHHGERQIFGTDVAQMDPALAESLARRSFIGGPAAADATVAAFLGLDARGDSQRANLLLERARAQGVFCGFWTEQLTAPAPSRVPHAVPHGTEADALGHKPSPTPAAVVRLPIPDEQQTARAIELIQESYPAILSLPATPAEQATLARSHLTKAGVIVTDAALRYALLTKSRDLALAAGDIETAWTATEELSAHFDSDSNALELESVRELARRAKSRHDVFALADHTLRSIKDAIDRHEFDVAKRLAELLARVVRRTKEPNLIKHVASLSRDLETIQEQYATAAPLLEVVRKDPDSEEANQGIGEYLLYYCGNANSAMPKLARGSHPLLSELAEREVTLAPRQTEQRLAVTDAWWDHAQQLKGLPARNVLDHAGQEYLELMPDITGVARKRVETRLQEIVNAGGLVTHQILLQNVLDNPWKVVWSTDPAWEKSIFLSNGTMETLVGGKTSIHKWRRTTSAIEVHGSGGTHVVVLYPLSRLQLFGIKYHTQTRKRICDGVGQRIQRQ